MWTLDIYLAIRRRTEDTRLFKHLVCLLICMPGALMIRICAALCTVHRGGVPLTSRPACLKAPVVSRPEGGSEYALRAREEHSRRMR